MIAETFWDLLKSPGHWYFELFLMFIFDVLIGLILWPRIKKHIHHDVEHRDEHPLDEDHD